MSGAPAPAKPSESTGIPGLTPSPLSQALAAGAPAITVLVAGMFALWTQMADLQSQLRSVSDNIQQIELSLALGTADRWTASQQREYAREVEDRLRDLEYAVQGQTP